MEGVIKLRNLRKVNLKNCSGSLVLERGESFFHLVTLTLVPVSFSWCSAPQTAAGPSWPRQWARQRRMGPKAPRRWGSRSRALMQVGQLRNARGKNEVFVSYWHISVAWDPAGIPKYVSLLN